jgi:beta-N-acetylhexosaminidase
LPGGLLRAVAALVAALAGVCVASGYAADPAPTLRQLVGQRLVVSFSGTAPSQSLLTRIRKGEIGGVIVFGPNVESTAQVRHLTDALHRAAHDAGQPRLLVMVDQEGGLVRRFRSAPPRLSAEELGSGSVANLRAVGLATAASLRSLGVDVDLAPVADVPRVPDSTIAAQDRAYSTSPSAAGAFASAFAQGLRQGGILATAKHFPGLGGAAGNTDLRRVSIATDPRTARADLVPFRRLVADGIPLVMLSNAVYPAYGPQPALLSPRIHSLLRKELGFTGATITDALDAVANVRSVPVATVALGAAGTGTDLLLFTGSEGASAGAFEALLSAARTGELQRASLERSYARILALKKLTAPG